MMDTTLRQRRWKRQGQLSRRDQEVMDTLRTSTRPMSAYDVMEHLRPQGVRAPTTVYRSLNRLMHLGLVHRLESLNAFVPCAHDGDHAGLFFAICESCGSVAEFTDTLIDEQLAARAKTAQFSVHQATLELKGQCRACMQVAKRQPDLS